MNRRSYETDNESDRGSKLEPLPEEKPPTISPPEVTVDQMPSNYKRVYPDWKPSSALEKTDVMGTMDAIAGMVRECIQSINLDSSYYFLTFQVPYHPLWTNQRGENLV